MNKENLLKCYTNISICRGKRTRQLRRAAYSRTFAKVIDIGMEWNFIRPFSFPKIHEVSSTSHLEYADILNLQDFNWNSCLVYIKYKLR